MPKTFRSAGGKNRDAGDSKEMFFSVGMIALGNCSTTEAPDLSQLSPIARSEYLLDSGSPNL